jgi:hypothetical protein
MRFTLTLLPPQQESSGSVFQSFLPLALICTPVVVFNIGMRRWCHRLTIIAVGAAFLGRPTATFPLADICDVLFQPEGSLKSYQDTLWVAWIDGSSSLTSVA